MKAFLSIAATLTLLSTSAFADAIRITNTRSVPQREVIASIAPRGHEAVEWYAYPARNHSRQDVAQTFRLHGGGGLRLHGVALRIPPGRRTIGWTAQGAPVGLAIHACSEPNKADKKNRLFSASTTLPRRMVGGDNLIFTLDKAIKLKKGQRYTLIFHFKGSHAGQSIVLAGGRDRGPVESQAFVSVGSHKGKTEWARSRADLSVQLLGH